MSTATTIPSPPPIAAPRWTETVPALAWRFVRRGWPSISLPLLLLCGMPTAMYLLVTTVHPNLVQNLSENPASLRRLFLMFAVGVLPTLILIEMLKVRPLYTLPLTTRQIVGTQTLLGALSLIVVYLLSALYFRVVFAAPIPVLGPLLILVPLLIIGAAIVALWTDAVWWKPIVSLAWLFGTFWWIGHRLTETALGSDATWFSPTLGELTLLVVAAGIAYAVAYRAVVRDRQGESKPWADLEEFLHRLGQAVGGLWTSPARVLAQNSTASHPTSALQALARYEWQSRGLVLPICVLGFGSVSLISAYYDPQNWLEAFLAALPGLLLFGMAINGYIVGLIDGPGMSGTMDRYRATRPLSDRQLALGLLQNGLVSMGIALFVGLGLALLVGLYHIADMALTAAEFRVTDPGVLWSWIRLGMRLPYGGSGEFGLALLAAAVAGWAGMGFNLSCMATGRHWIISGLWLAGVGVLVANIMLGARLGDEQTARLMHLLLLILAGVSVVLTIGCFWSAIRRQIIAPHSWLVLCGLWLAGAVVLVSGALKTPADNLTLLAVAGLSSLVALPLAAAPLAVHWNRHR